MVQSISTEPPRWARWLDLLFVTLVGVAVLVALLGGVRIRIAFVRLSLTSPWRIAIAAIVVTVVRHIALPQPAIYRDLPVRASAWQRDWVIDDVDVGTAAPIRLRTTLGIVVLFSALTAVMTFPLIFHIRDGLADPGDPLLNTWALRWVVHQLIASPTHLFDGNIFAPERNTLAYSETLIAPAIVTAPLAWIGVGPIAVHNIVFLAGLIASGVGVTLLVRDLTGRLPAAVLSGVVFAFLPFRFDHFPQLQLQQAQWIPLAVWAVHRIVREGRIRAGIGLGVAVAAQLMSCMYYGIFLMLYLAVFGGCLLLWRLRSWRRWMPGMVAAVLTAIVLFAPAAKAYLEARTVVGERGRQENVSYSATIDNYAAAPDKNWVYGWTSKRFGGLERNLFPGIVALALTAVALWPPLSAVRLTYAIALAFAVDLTLGFNGLSYPLLYKFVSPVRALRIPALAVIVVGFSLAVLAGFGAARLRRGALTAVMVALVMLESASLPMPLTTIPTDPPAIYNELLRDNAGRPASTIVELPIDYTRSGHYEDQIYMYYSTFHWQKLVNGYSGFFPPAYLEAAALMRTFPDARSLAALKSRDVRYVVIHGERMTADAYRRLVFAVDECGCGLTLVAKQPWQSNEISVYRISL